MGRGITRGNLYPAALRFLLILATAAVAVAAERVPAGLNAADRRLSSPVKVAVRREPVPALLKELGEQTGVTLRAEGPAADLHVTAFAESPLKELLERLALLLHLTWRPSGEPSRPEYILYASKEDLRAARSAGDRDRRLLRNELKQLVLTLSQGQPPAGDDAKARRARSLLMLSSTQPMAQMLCQLPGPLFDACLNGREIRLGWGQMSPAMRQAFTSFLAAKQAEIDRSRQLFAGPAREQGVILSAPPPADPSGLVFSCALTEMLGSGRSASLKIGAGNGFVTLSARPAEQDEFPNNASQRHFLSREMSAHAGDWTLPDPLKPWEITLEQFARQNRVAVLSDAFDTDDCPTVRRFSREIWPPEKGTPERLLDQFCSVYDYQWNASAPVHLFRRRDWYALRERQIPDSRWQGWRDRSTRTGRFELGDLAEMAALGEAQRSKLIRYAGQDAWREALRNRELLAFYSLLSARQRAGLTPDGVSVNDLTLSQKRALSATCEKLAPAATGVRPDPVRVTIREDRDATSLVLAFRDGSRHAVRFGSRPPKMLDPWAALGR